MSTTPKPGSLFRVRERKKSVGMQYAANNQCPCLPSTCSFTFCINGLIRSPKRKEIVQVAMKNTEGRNGSVNRGPAENIAQIHPTIGTVDASIKDKGARIFQSIYIILHAPSNIKTLVITDNHNAEECSYPECRKTNTKVKSVKLSKAMAHALNEKKRPTRANCE